MILRDLLLEKSNPMITLGNKLLKYEPSMYDDLKKWLDGLRLTGKAPRGMKDEFANIQFLQKQVDMIEKFPKMTPDDNFNIGSVFSWWDKETIQKIVDKLSKVEGETDTLKIGTITFTNKSTINFKKFQQHSNYIAGELKKLKGFHKKALKGGLKIKFVKKDECKSKAKYKGDKDELYIRPDRMEKGDGYASLIYVVLHELGHRFERKVKSYNNVPYTTKYSKTQSFDGDEAFAELFAISHWKKDYPEYKKQIAEFTKMVK